MSTDTKKYYYVKPKSSRPLTRNSVVIPVSSRFTNPSSTLNMAFSEATVQSTAVVWLWAGLKLVLIVMLALLLYIGGGLVYQSANNVKGQITDLANRGIGKLEAAAAAVLAQDISGARDNFVAAENLFATAQTELLALGQTNLYMSGLASDGSQIVAGQKLIDSGLSLAQAGITLIDTMTPLWQYFNGLSTSGNQAQDLAGQIVGLMGQSSNNLDRALAQVTKANTLLSSINPKTVDSTYATALSEAQIKTATLQSTVMTLGTLAKELPDALGFNNPRQYLILNQNNNELRATGGFVGSYMLVEVYKGKLKSVLVDMTQRIDGQNPNSSLTLPKPLEAITTSFGTRDANWYADFPTSAQTFQKLYEQAGGGTADGVIAINPEVIKDILTVLGPVYLENKELTLTADNFVSATQAQIELIDNQKENPKEVLNEFAPILLGRLLTANGAVLKQINLALMSRLQQKDVLIYLRNPKLEPVMNRLSVAGVLPETTSGGDFLGVVRANLGGRKSSQNVQEEIHHTANVNLTGDVNVALQLKYTHTGSYIFPDGPNKDYVRVYLPKDTVKVSVVGQDYETTVEQYDENGKTVLAFWLTTNPGESKTVELNYRLPGKVTDYYQLNVFKQPGANNTTLTSILKLSPALGLAENDMVKTKQLFSDKLQTDLKFGVEIIQIN
nr:hypothetical protein [uncultured bacterium]